MLAPVAQAAANTANARATKSREARVMVGRLHASFVGHRRVPAAASWSRQDRESNGPDAAMPAPACSWRSPVDLPRPPTEISTRVPVARSAKTLAFSHDL